MTSYSVLLTTGFRADCKGKGIAQAMKSLAKENPDIVPLTGTQLQQVSPRLLQSKPPANQLLGKISCLL